MKERSRIIMILSAMLIALVMVPTLPSFADTGDPAVVKGSSVLGKNPNGSGMQRVWYGGETWYVISYNNNGHYAVKEDGIITLFRQDTGDKVKFCKDYSGDNTYAGSDLQAFLDGWLSGDSPKFSAGEQNAMVQRRLEGGGADLGEAGYDAGKMKGPSVDAWIWPLSASEARAVSQRKIEGKNWWTRTPGEAGKVAYVLYTGIFDEYGLLAISYNYVRPAFNLDMDSVVLSSAAEGGKPAINSGDPLQTPGTNSSDQWKLTVKDSPHSGFSVTPISLTDGLLKFDYSGAVTGTNEYISAIIVKADGNTKYYGKLQEVSRNSGTVSFNVSGKWDIDAGDSLYVFNEKCNNDYETDYASPLQEIDAIQFYFSGVGTEDKPYIINNKTKWDALADYVAKGHSTAGMHVQLDNNLTVDNMVGTESKPFGGIFNGKGNTLTVDLTGSDSFTAPFCYVKGAVFSNLRVNGAINVTGGTAAGLVGKALGNCSITNCACDVDITGDGGNAHAGFAGDCDGGTVSVTGSVFTGSIDDQKASYCAGFLGWQGDTAENCLYDGTMNTKNKSNDFIRTNDVAKNCYYLNSNGIDRIKGKQALSITGAEGISVKGKEGTAYNVSGITAYDTGMMYDGVFYAGAEETVSLDLTATFSEMRRFGVNAGSLTGSGNNYQLVMPDENVLVSSEWIKLPAPRDVKWTVNETEGVLNQNNGLRASWSVSEGATGYYVTPCKVENGSFKPICEPIDVNPYVYEGKASYNLTDVTLQNERVDSGEFAFTIQAHDDNGVISDVVKSDSAEVYRLKLHMYGSPTLYVRKGVNIAGCLTRYFDNDVSTGRYIENGNYYYIDRSVSGGETIQVLAFIPKRVDTYDSLSDLKADAILVPKESSSAKTISEDQDIYLLTEKGLCTDGELHSFELEDVETKASTDYSGRASFRCSKCGFIETRTIQKLKRVKTSAPSYTYSGKAIKPIVTVLDDDGQAVPVSEYIVDYKGNIDVGTSTVWISFLNSKLYSGFMEHAFDINPANVNSITFPKIAAATYTGKQIKPAFKAKYNGLTLKSSDEKVFTVAYGANKNAGKGTITIKGKGNYNGSKTLTFTINKAANPLKVKAKTGTVKFKKLQKKNQTLAVTKVMSFAKALKDRKTYTLSSAKKGKKSFKKYFKINKATGKVTIRKNRKMKKGIYKLTVKVKASGNKNYKASGVKKVTVTIRVK